MGLGWLSMNWIWIAIAIGIAYYFLRRGHGAQGSRRDAHQLEAVGHHVQTSDHAPGNAQAGPDPDTAAPQAAVDPVGGEAVRTNQALTSLYQGRIYYFVSKENRERFEASPQAYAATGSGHAAPGSSTAHEGAHRHRGC